MSSISSISSSHLMTSYSGTSGMKRPSADQMAEKLFSKLDKTGKGYIEQSDIESALSSLSSGSSTTGIASASEIFNQFDSDGDGKVTQDEMTTSLQNLSESLDSQFNQMRMQGGMPPPPPPAESGSGFTKDELTSQLSEIDSNDTAQASLLNDIVQNFDAADTDGDGKVSFQEAMAYQQSTESASTATSSSTPETSGAQNADAKVFQQIMELMRAYGSSGSSDTDTNLISALTSTISITA